MGMRPVLGAQAGPGAAASLPRCDAACERRVGPGLRRLRTGAGRRPSCDSGPSDSRAAPSPTMCSRGGGGAC